MTAISSWRKIAEPHRDIREERFDPAVFAADLGMVLRDEGPIDYRDPVTFFKKTYLTRGLSSLLLDALLRLSGERRGEAVVQIQTPFGGGKTHVLIALYHLLAHSDQIEHLPPIQSLLEDAGLDSIPDCRVAVLVGTALDPARGRTTEEELHLRTLWEEMAYQLGGTDLYQRLRAESGERSAPGTDTLMDLLDGLGPVVVLVDEALEYATKAGAVETGEGTLLGQTLAFLQELSTVAAHRPQTTLVGAIPLSYLERFDASAQKAFQQLNKIFGRLEQIRTPVEGAEIYEILRRRLFEDIGAEVQRREAAEAYWDFYQAHSGDLPRKVREISYRERMVRAYPFHPELIDILYERWGSLPNFQRTRGVLRLLAMVVGDLYRTGSMAAMIQPAHVNLGNSRIRREFINLVDSAYETVVGSDISGHTAKAAQIDHELGGEYAREHIAEALATSIFLYSHTGGTDQGAVLPQLRLSLLHPEMSAALVADALDRLSSRLWYLYEDPKWRFDKVPNLNKMLVEREDAIKGEEIRARIRSALGDLAGQRTFRRTYLWPQEDRDIADDRQLGLVILDLDCAAGSRETEEFIRSVLKKRGDAFRTYRNTLIFLLPDRSEVERVREAARTLLALEGIAADYGGSDRLTDRQQKKLEEDLDAARSALPQMVYQAYRHIVIPGENDDLLRLDMGLQLLREGRSLSQQAWEHLAHRDRLLERLDPYLIRADRWTLWPAKEQPLQTSQLRDYFARYTQLPMLASEEVLTQAIGRGVELELFGYGHRAGEQEDISSLYFGQAVPPQQVEIADTTWLIPPDVAREGVLGSISGRVLGEAGESLAGVAVRLSPASQAVTTGADGNFEFDRLPPDEYVLAPSKSGYIFSPSSRSVSLSGDDVAGLEFVGRETEVSLVTYELAGQVRTEDGKVLGGVRLAIDPPVAAEVVSDSSGQYAFQGLQEGAYTVRPYKVGITFVPAETTVTVSQDVSVQDFVAKREAKRARHLEISTRVLWERWYDFYSDVIDPLMSAGAEIDIHLDLEAHADRELGGDLVERLQDSLRRHDRDARLDTG